jgi:hypothetical protein
MSTKPRPANIDAYLRGTDPKRKDVAHGVRNLVKRALPKATEPINPWGIPSFDLGGPLCWLMVGKNHVTFGFLRGTSLDDPHGLLEGTGKNLRHAKLRRREDLEREGLRELILAAAKLNRSEPLTASGRREK